MTIATNPRHDNTITHLHFFLKRVFFSCIILMAYQNFFLKIKTITGKRDKERA